MEGKENVLSHLTSFLKNKNFPASAKFVSTYHEKKLFWPGNSKINNYRVIEVCNQITPELLNEWPKACKEIVENFNLNKLLSLYVDRLESGQEYRTAGDLLAKYLDTACQKETLNIIEHPKLTKEDLRPVKQHNILKEEEVIKKLKSEMEIYIDDISKSYLVDPIDYAEYYNITFEGKPLVHYAIEHNLKIKHNNPMNYAIDEFNKSGDHKFCIKDSKTGIEKTPIHYAIDNNIKLGLQNNQDPVIYAIEEESFFTSNGAEINSLSTLVEYALRTRKIEDNRELIKYAIDNGIKIQNKDPIVYFQEKGKEFYIKDNRNNLISPIEYAIVKRRKN
ncbi:MAG: hypothetical protein RCG15_00800 [Candidatus Rickettsia vulgarisii]